MVLCKLLLGLMATAASATKSELLEDDNNYSSISNETALSDIFSPNNEKDGKKDSNSNQHLPELTFELMSKHNRVQLSTPENLNQGQNRMMVGHQSPNITNNKRWHRPKWEEESSSRGDESRSWEQNHSYSGSRGEEIRSESRSRERFRSESRSRERFRRRPRHRWHGRPKRRWQGRPKRRWQGRPKQRCQPCPPGWEDQRFRFGKCYREYCHGTCKFDTAILTCKTIGVRGSRLVEPSLTNGELTFLFKFVRVEQKLWWIGIKRINNNLQYIESGQAVAESTVPWANGEPTKGKQECLAFRKGGNQRLNDEPCHDAWGFAICEVRRRPCRRPFR